MRKWDERAHGTKKKTPTWTLVGVGVALFWIGRQTQVFQRSESGGIFRPSNDIAHDQKFMTTARNLSAELETNTRFKSYLVHPVTNEWRQAKLWNRARKLLDLAVADGEALVDPKQKDVARRFYTQCGLQNLALMNGNSVYVRIPKNGNNNIRCNLASFPGEQEELKCLRQVDGLKLVSSGVKVWTFVREPISRFVSGYTEVEFRNRDDPKVQEHFKHKLGTKERFREYVVSMLDGHRVHAIFHTYSQSWIGTTFPVLNAGKIENMEEDWSALQVWLGLRAPQPFNKNCSTHPTSSDPLATSAAARQALEEDPALLNALCALLLPDFLNFHYQLPSACLDGQNFTHIWTHETAD